MLGYTKLIWGVHLTSNTSQPLMNPPRGRPEFPTVVLVEVYPVNGMDGNRLFLASKLNFQKICIIYNVVFLKTQR
jgi:hypothetical protein